jgi:hypothetical protein
MARYKKIGLNKWLRLKPYELEPWYFDGEQDDKDRVVADNYVPYRFNEIIISTSDPNEY